MTDTVWQPWAKTIGLVLSWSWGMPLGWICAVSCPVDMQKLHNHMSFNFMSAKRDMVERIVATWAMLWITLMKPCFLSKSNWRHDILMAKCDTHVWLCSTRDRHQSQQWSCKVHVANSARMWQSVSHHIVRRCASSGRQTHEKCQLNQLHLAFQTAIINVSTGWFTIHSFEPHAKIFFDHVFCSDSCVKQCNCTNNCNFLEGAQNMTNQLSFSSGWLTTATNKIMGSHDCLSKKKLMSRNHALKWERKHSSFCGDNNHCDASKVNVLCHRGKQRSHHVEWDIMTERSMNLKNHIACVCHWTVCEFSKWKDHISSPATTEKCNGPSTAKWALFGFTNNHFLVLQCARRKAFQWMCDNGKNMFSFLWSSTNGVSSEQQCSQTHSSVSPWAKETNLFENQFEHNTFVHIIVMLTWVWDHQFLQACHAPCIGKIIGHMCGVGKNTQIAMWRNVQTSIWRDANFDLNLP